MRLSHLRRSCLVAILFLAAGHPADARDCTQSQYQSDTPKITLAFGSGILKNDKGTSLFVSEKYWNGLAFDRKVDFLESISCAAAGVGKGLASITLRSDMTGKVVGEWSWGKLTVP